MRKTALAIAASALTLTGCATTDYKLYTETQVKIAQASAQAEAMKESARYAALAEIAKTGDSAARVAAVMSINFGANAPGGKQPMPAQVAPPVHWSDTALKWTGVILPTLTNTATVLYAANANKQVALAQSNNAAAVAASTNATFATMSNNQATSSTAIANAGFTAATNIANSGLTAVTTTAANGLTATQNVATAGITGIVTTAANGLTAATSISTNANTAITNVSNAANASIQTLANAIPNLQPNVTTTTSTTTTTNQCGSNASGGTVTCP